MLCIEIWVAIRSSLFNPSKKSTVVINKDDSIGLKNVIEIIVNRES